MSLFEKTGFVMTAGGTDDNHINHDNLNGPYTFIDAYDRNEPPDNMQPFTSADKANTKGSRDDDGDEEKKGDITGRVRGSDTVLCSTMLTTMLVNQHCPLNIYRVPSSSAQLLRAWVHHL